MQPGTIFTKSSDAISCELETGAAILDSRSNMYFALNATGAYVWNMLPARMGDIVAKLIEEYGAERERVEADVLVLLDQLKGNQLIVTVGDEATNASQPA